jgi:ABC-type uncharacterized transport system substrate-binding protein
MLWKKYSGLIRRQFRLTLWVFLAALLLCDVSQSGERNTPALSPFWGKKILWVDSYHPSYEWSAGIEQGIRHELQNSGADLRILRMDSKRRSTEKQKRGAALRAKAEVEAFRPDVVIASDDNAVKYLVVPYLKDTELPVVFCGVNWDASVYGLPAPNVTGMVELDLVETQIKHLSRYAKGRRIGYLSGDVFTERKIVEHYNRFFFDGRMKSRLVRSLREFKQAFLQMQNEVDMLYIYNYAGISDWDPVAAETFIAEHVRIPTGSHNPFMAPFVLVTLAKDPKEQGEWAARAALNVLAGTNPADIPLAHNERGQLTVNLRMAHTLGITFPLKTLEAASVIGQEALH